MPVKDVTRSVVSESGQYPTHLGAFLEAFEPEECKRGQKLILWTDARSGAYYVTCHLRGSTIAQRADLAAVMDPEADDEYRMNRDLVLDTYAYRVMEQDAKAGRSFEDIVVQFDESYKSAKPLKVFGGQHRVHAITEAAKDNSAGDRFHGPLILATILVSASVI